MNVALVTVAQGIIKEHDKYLEINQNEHLLDKVQADHNKVMVKILNRLKQALAGHVEEAGYVDDELLAKIVIETHGEIVTEFLNWREDKQLAASAAALGSITSDAKAAAARANGKKGGRPRKQTE